MFIDQIFKISFFADHISVLGLGDIDAENNLRMVHIVLNSGARTHWLVPTDIVDALVLWYKDKVETDFECFDHCELVDSEEESEINDENMIPLSTFNAFIDLMIKFLDQTGDEMTE